jgi:4-amino-4-deoxy-L-arabinose transferase-like glycosyltransferase
MDAGAEISGEHNRMLYGILALALILRFAVIAYLGERALQFSSDSQAYQDIAVNLVEHGRFITAIDPPHTLDKPYANRPPVTPWVLAGIYELFGVRLLFGQILLALVGVGACFAVFRLGNVLFGRQVGLWAGLLAAVNPLWALFAAVPMTESVAILLYPVLVLWCLHLRQDPSIRNATIMGLLLGVTALNKATILPFAPFWAIWVFIVLAPRWRRALSVVCVTAAVCTAVILPWTVRNYRLFGRLIPISLQAGHSMYEANNPYTEYALERVERGETWLNDPRYGGPLTGLSQLEVEDKGRELALAFMRGNPGLSIEFAWRRLCVFWGSYNSFAHRAFWYFVGPLFAIGFLLVWKARFREWRELFIPSFLILQTMSLVALFPSMPRYRVPIEPFVLVFAAYTITRMVQPLRAARERLGI